MWRIIHVVVSTLRPVLAQTSISPDPYFGNICVWVQRRRRSLDCIATSLTMSRAEIAAPTSSIKPEKTKLNVPKLQGIWPQITVTVYYIGYSRTRGMPSSLRIARKTRITAHSRLLYCQRCLRTAAKLCHVRHNLNGA